MAKKNMTDTTETTTKAKPTKVTLSPAQVQGLKTIGAMTGWTKISPDAAAQRGWLLHWRAYPKLQAAGLLDVKVQDNDKVGHVVLAKLTAQGKKVLKTLP